MDNHIFSSEEVTHIFANNPKAYVANSSRTLRADSGVLWSYHEPIAMYHGNTVLISSDSFGISTRKHLYWAHYALNHKNTLKVPSLKALRGCVTEIAFAEWIAKRMKEMDKIRESITRMRVEGKKAGALRKIAYLESVCAYVWSEMANKSSPWQSSQKIKKKSDKAAAIWRYTISRDRLETGMENAKRMIDIFRTQMADDVAQNRDHGPQQCWRLENAVADIRRLDEMSAHCGLGIGRSASFARAAKLMGKKWAKECEILALALVEYADSFQSEIQALRADYDHAEQLANSVQRAEWFAGGRFAPRGDVVLRVIGDTVETSKGARVPLSDGLALAALAKKCCETGKGIDLRNRRVGNYHGNSIDSAGNLTAGCHLITYAAITDCVARYEASKESRA
jgi:protein-tyrosine phosphatase